MIDFLKQNQISYQQNVPLSASTSFRIGGNAAVVMYPDSFEQAQNLIQWFVQKKMQYFVMGNGSDLLFSDQPFLTPIIKTDKLLTMRQSGDSFVFGAGVKLAAAAAFAAEKGYSGLEFAQGIPGSIGGALYMNAGAYDGVMSDIVVSTLCIDENGQRLTLDKDEHDFGYRHSFFSDKNCFIVETVVKLNVGDPQQIRAKMDDLASRRKAKQPLNYPSAGSTFKRPNGAYAAKLIEECGLKGYQIGGAQVSEKHCGFIINKNHASFEDVLRLIEFVQQTVLQKTGYTLECEVKIIQ